MSSPSNPPTRQRGSPVASPPAELGRIGGAGGRGCVVEVAIERRSPGTCWAVGTTRAPPWIACWFGRVSVMCSWCVGRRASANRRCWNISCRACPGVASRERHRDLRGGQCPVAGRDVSPSTSVYRAPPVGGIDRLGLRGAWAQRGVGAGGAYPEPAVPTAAPCGCWATQTRGQPM
jgi:hypothetical protein